MTGLDKLTEVVDAAGAGDTENEGLMAPCVRARTALLALGPALIAVARAGERISAHVLHDIGDELAIHQDHEAALAALRGKLSDMYGAEP